MTVLESGLEKAVWGKMTLLSNQADSIRSDGRSMSQDRKISGLQKERRKRRDGVVRLGAHNG